MIKVGLCGFGSMAKGHAQMLKLHDDVKLVAIADAVEENRSKAAELYGVKVYESGEELIDAGGLDVVFVVVPTYLHNPLAIRALRSGCHVFCEKPMALNPQLCQEMIDEAKKADKMLMIGQVLRFWPEYVFLKKTVDSRPYGRLLALSMQRVGGVSTGWQGWYLDEQRGGSQLFDRHIHDADAILWMLGKPREIRTHGCSRDSRIGGGVFHSFTEYYYNDDMVVSAEGSADTVAGFPFTASYRAVFENAVIEFDSRRKPTLLVYAGAEPFSPEMEGGVEDLRSGMNIKNAGPYFFEQRYFFNCLAKGVRPETVTPESAMQTIELVKAEVESAKTRKPVRIQ